MGNQPTFDAIESLFRSVADLTPDQRSTYYTEHHVDPLLQKEVERLLQFDQEDPHDIQSAIGEMAASAVDPNVGRKCGPYVLKELLGRGGMGVVYLGERTDGEVRQQAAIKMLHPFFGSVVATDPENGHWRQRFLRERQLLAQLNHPAIARLLDAGHTADGIPFLVMEYIAGTPIDKHVQSRELPLDARIELFLAVCDAVAHAHRSLVIHRDIKPSNILVDDSGRPKLLDFGIAKAIGAETGEPLAGVTRTMERMLTPSFASPEQVRGELQTTATDIFSLGATLHKLLTGEVPPRESADIHHPALPSDIGHILRKAMREEPGERYLSVDAMAADLRRFLRHEPITARPESLFYRASRFVRRNTAVSALAGVAAVAIIAGAASTWLQMQDARKQRDYAYRQLARSVEVNELNALLLFDAAPLGKPFQVNDLLARAEHIVERQAAQGGIDPATRVGLLITIGTQYAAMDESKRATAVLQRAYQMSRSLNDPSVRARASCAVVRGSDNADTAGSLRFIEEGLSELPKEPMYALDRMFCLQGASDLMRHAGNGREAVVRILEAQRALESAPYRSPMVALSLTLDLAESYRVEGNLRESVEVSEKAAAMMTALGRDETQRAGTLFNNWALTLSLLGRPLDAERVFRRAIAIGKSDEKDENAVSPMLLLNYGRALGDLGRYDEARDYVRRAAAGARRSGLRVVQLQSLVVGAGIERATGNPGAAAAAIGELEPMLRAVYPPGHAGFASLISQQAMNAQAAGDLHTALKLSDQAVSMLEASIAAGKEGGDFLPFVLQRRAEVHLQNPHSPPAKAEADARRSLELLSRADSKPGRPPLFSTVTGKSYLLLARALRARKQPSHEAYRGAWEHYHNAAGPQHPQTVEARNGMQPDAAGTSH